MLLLALVACAAQGAFSSPHEVYQQVDTVVPQKQASRPFVNYAEVATGAVAPTFHISEFSVVNASADGVERIHKNGLWIRTCVQNRGASPQRFASRNTPFELENRLNQSLISSNNVYRVKRVNQSGIPMKSESYRGAEIKRTSLDSAHAHGFTLQPNETRCVTENIAEMYAFTADDTYLISLREPVDHHLKYTDRPTLSVSIAGAKELTLILKQRFDQFLDSAVLVQGASSEYPLITKDCNAAQQNQLAELHREAIAWMKQSKNHSHGSEHTNRWFGSVSAGNYDARIVEGFTKMLAFARLGTTYVCLSSACGSCDCAGGRIFGYVYPTHSEPRIWLCSMIFDYDPASERMQTIVHEFSHFYRAADTKDFSYGEDNCKALAQVDPYRAAKNADSYGYFARDVGAATRWDVSIGTMILPIAMIIHHTHNWI